jgi:hypothetical protein
VTVLARTPPGGQRRPVGAFWEVEGEEVPNANARPYGPENGRLCSVDFSST